MIEDWCNGRRIGIFGEKGRDVIVLHGGPGAAGSSDAVALELSDTFKTASPWQRRRGDSPLTVDIHVQDLKDLIEWKCANGKPALVGESWGAMLALAFACKYPAGISSIALVGCGTYAEGARKRLFETRIARIHEFVERNPEYAEDLKLPIMDQIMKWHEMTDTYCAQEERPTLPGPTEVFDKLGSEETWKDMVHCQQKEIYPQQFVNIKCPVIMLHGSYDPHPGRMIVEQLRKYMPQLEYREMEKCGHAPSIEKYARTEFYSFLKSWLSAKMMTSTIPET
jgi:pimeloyl-ACP methyl ester carboxylesterase